MSVERAWRALERGMGWLGAFVAWATLVPLIAVSVYDIVGHPNGRSPGLSPPRMRIT